MKKVLLGLSGGVDSAVAAYILIKQGYEVIAGFMKNYAEEHNPQCQTRKDKQEAIKVCKHLGIKDFHIFDFREEYHKKIIEYIYKTYYSGRTPNPDILCNKEIKFKLFLEKGLQLGCHYVATGHYARIEIQKGQNGKNTYHLLRGIDTTKDQSYFLSGLHQRQLQHILFPLGTYTKTQVRKIAREIGLPNANRKDSQGLCFIGKVHMKTFLEKYLPKKTGYIVNEKGNIIGKHDGVRFYTIGQRHGLGLSQGPRYVLERDIQNNILIVGHKDANKLFHTGLILHSLHWLTGNKKKLPRSGYSQIRYRQTGQQCTLTHIQTQNIGGSTELPHYHLQFSKPQRAISPGQTAVLYEGNEVIASGIIEKAK